MYFQQFGRKYKNIFQEYGGRQYASQLEASKAKELDLLLKAKEIKGWEAQVTIPLEVNKEVVCRYRVDFVVYHFDGLTEYIECKGFWTPEGRLKWKLFEAIMKDKILKGKVKLTISK